MRARLLLSWLIGISLYITIYIFMREVLDFLGTPTYLDFDQPLTVRRYYGREIDEYEVDGEPTAVGITIVFIAVMTATRVGMFIYSGRLNGNISKEGNVHYLAWLFGSLAYGIGGTLNYLIFHTSSSSWLNFTGNILELGMLIGIFFTGKFWLEKRIQKIRANKGTL